MTASPTLGRGGAPALFRPSRPTSLGESGGRHVAGSPGVRRPALRRAGRLLAGAAVTAAAVAWMSPAGIALALVGVLVALLFAVSASSLWLSLHAWQTPENMEHVGFDTPLPPVHGFSLIVPVRGEEYEVLRPTIMALAAQDHPDVEIVTVVSGDDDDSTRLAAERIQHELAVSGRPGLLTIVHVSGPAKNKPKALVAGLQACSKDLVGVFDAESIAAPRILVHVDTMFQTARADVVQCGVQLMNYDSSWYSLQNVLEYYRWFKSRLHTQAQRGFIPLGGNTVFVRREVLDAVGGWDQDNLTEDCDLGVRMSAASARVAVAYDPWLATREETPGSLSVLYRQRTRWMQGFLQTYLKGDWRRLPRLRQRLLARYTLLMPFVQALAGVLIPLSALAAFVLDLPILLALATFLPVAPAAATMVSDAVQLKEFSEEYGLEVTWRHFGVLVLGAFPFQLVLSASAVKAVVRQLLGRKDWYKTAHTGQHHRSPAVVMSGSR